MNSTEKSQAAKTDVWQSRVRLEPGEPRNIGVFGGSFDPPHMGHVWLAGWALSCSANIDYLLVVPCWRHAFGKKMTPFAHRFQMCQEAFCIYGDKVIVSGIERDHMIQYTVSLLRLLKRQYPKDNLILFIGADEAEHFQEWHEYEKISQLAKVVTIGREGYTQGNASIWDAPILPNISSSALRAAVDGMCIPRNQIPHRVLQYIQAAGLYTTKHSPIKYNTEPLPTQEG